MPWAPPYVTRPEAKAFQRIRGGDSVDDAYLDLAVEASSRAIDLSCGRQFGKVDTPEQRFYTARWDRERCLWVVPIDDLMDVTGLQAEVQDAEGETVGAIDSYVLEPRNALVKGKPYERLVVRRSSTHKPCGATDEVALNFLPGWNAFPGTVVNACLVQMNRFVNRRDSPYGVAGSPENGSEMRLLAKLDPDVALMLTSFRRVWFVAPGGGGSYASR